MSDKISLVLDKWVIARAASEEEESFSSARAVLQKLLHQCHIVVLDGAEPTSQIFEEWRRYLWRSDIIRGWFIRMISSGKLVWRSRERLQLFHFPDPDDEKFIQRAVTLPSKVFITGDQKLINWGKSGEEKKLGIRVWGIEEALEKL